MITLYNHPVSGRITIGPAKANVRATIQNSSFGPTVTGATSTLATLLGTPTVGVLTTFDLRDAWRSPATQAMTFTVSYGTIAGDGFTFSWTPTAQEYSDANGTAAFATTATDTSGRIGSSVNSVAMSTGNTAPTSVNQIHTHVVGSP